MTYRYAFAVLGLGFLILFGGLYYADVGVWDVFSRIAPHIKTDVEVSEPSAFTVPEGFAVSVFSDQVVGARALAYDPRGVLVVSSFASGAVFALPDTDNDGKAEAPVAIVTGLDQPHGIAFIDSDLYIAETGAVQKYAYNPETRTATFTETVAVLPTGGGHFTRSLLVHPDGKTLLVSVGSSCNVCDESDVRRAAVLAVDLETKEVSVFARGLRNTVFMAVNPVDGAVWGTDMGRDLLGDDIPPDEVNVLEKGGNYGWPICYGKNIHDTDYDKNTYIRAPCNEPFELPSLIDVPAHSAPLGIAFIPEEGWPEKYRLDTLVAYHGSWNRSEPSGYKVVRFDTNGSRIGVEADFMTGFITEEGTVLGRPVDLLATPGGQLYVSDDHAGAVYRVTLVDESALE